MRSTIGLLAAGVLALGLAGPAVARGGKAAPVKGSQAATCGDYGTSVHFEKSPSEAATRARKEEKLVLVLHISGHFENSDFT